MDALTSLLETLSLITLPLLFLLIGTHIFLTIRLGFIQRHMLLALKISMQRKPEGSGDISQFAALMTALAATIGTGNIVGVATAIAAGGPGAVFWMWLAGVFGIATKYTEALLAVKYRITTKSGEMAGGPMYVLERGLNNKPLAVLFAVFTAIAAFGIGNTVQANSIALLLRDAWEIPQWVSGLVITLLTALVILGGVRSIARVCSKLVPAMALLYVGGCLVLLVMHLSDLPAALVLIVKSAFTGQSAAGGVLGAGVAVAMRYGIARGLFSNESGMGSAAIIAAAAQTKNPVRQALVSSTGTFWDTVVVCAVTGLVLVASGEWMKPGMDGAVLTRAAFHHMGSIGSAILCGGLLTFVFSTILGWSYYAEKSLEYLFGERAVFPYRVVWVAAVMVGSVLTLKIVWTFAEIANSLMAFPNLYALIALSGVAVAETRRYLPEEKRAATRKSEVQESTLN